MGLPELFEKNLKYISRTMPEADIIDGQFVKSKTRDYLTVGNISLPSGRIRVGDPLAYMSVGQFSPELNQSVKAGVYSVEIAVSRSAVAGKRICTARLKFSDKKAVRYELAKSTDETAVMQGADGPVHGFPVDAGMMSFMDSAVLPEYIAFLDKWHKDNPDSNHYDDYFAAIFADSYKKLPEFQRSGGAFIEWTIPGTDHKLVMLSSGFGDGFYSCYWGIDKTGEICDLTVPLINADIVDKENERFLNIWNGPEYCIVTNNIANGGEICYMCRKEPSQHFEDSGWSFYGKGENDDYWNDVDNYTLYSIHRLAERFPAIIPHLRSPTDTAFICTDNGEFILDDYEENED